MKTEKKMTTLAKFAEFAKSEADALTAKPDADRSALLKANLTKAAAVDKADAEFEVEVLAEAPPAMDLTTINAKLDKIDAAVATFSGGVTAKGLYDAVVTKQGIAVQLAVELLTAYAAKVSALSAKLQSGATDINKDEVWAAMCSYNIESAVMDALTTLGKSETPPDSVMLSEVGETVKAEFAKKSDALKVVDDAAKKAADEKAKADADAAAAAEAAKKAEEDAKKADTCEQCGAAMGGADVCPECGWKKGEEVTEKSAGAGSYPNRYRKPTKTEKPVKR